ncbi:MAG: biosynthetic-type acetolactate synthase large subunit [Gammaproteobacteria bacterium]
MTSTRISGSKAILESLAHQGVDIVFGYPGGAIMPLYDALHDMHHKIRHILVRHEQGAVHAAEGYARACGKTGVCIATSGPGATNLVTGIADAMLDSVPVVCITGQVASHLLGTDAFQEVDIIGITVPITKWNYQITHSDEIPEIIAKAFYIANTGRPGPVLIDITKDAQFGMLDYTPHQYKPNRKEALQLDIARLQLAADLINQAKKPYILAGHGVLIANAQQALINFAQQAHIPIAQTLLGLSAVPNDHPLYVGMLGMHGNYGANVLTNEADVIIAIGMRFDDRVTGNLNSYAKQAKIIHIDIDPVEIDKHMKTEVALISDAKIALEKLLPLINKNSHSDWFKQFQDHDKKEYQVVIEPELDGKHHKLRMAEVVNQLSEKTKGNAIIVTDVGQHQMIAARYYRFNRTHAHISSGGAGTMGFALPAGIGAQFAQPKTPVIVINGDGGFQMNIQELGVIAQENLNVKIIILNNNYLGMVRQWQELFFEKRYSFTHLKNPDFIKIAQAYGIKAKRVSDRSELNTGLDEMLQANEAFLLEVVVEAQENIFPMIASGTGVGEMRLT